MSSKPQPVRLLGLAFDGDGHKRLTQGPGFTLCGGSEETHETMTETTIKISEKLKKRGKDLASVSSEEFHDIACSVGLVRRSPQNN